MDNVLITIPYVHKWCCQVDTCPHTHNSYGWQLMRKTMAFIYSDKLHLNTQISVGITFILCVSINTCIKFGMYSTNSMYLICSVYYYLLLLTYFSSDCDVSVMPFVVFSEFFPCVTTTSRLHRFFYILFAVFPKPWRHFYVFICTNAISDLNVNLLLYTYH